MDLYEREVAFQNALSKECLVPKTVLQVVHALSMEYDFFKSLPRFWHS
jgi:hypothetical protein